MIRRLARMALVPALLVLSFALGSLTTAQVCTVASEEKISETAGGFGGDLDANDSFGRSVCRLGDLDGDGNVDLAVGASEDDDGGVNRGAVWILFLNTDGTVQAEQKVSSTAGGFVGLLGNSDEFGFSLSRLGDLDGDGTEDLAVGTPFDDGGGSNQGALWVLFLDVDGTVKAEQKIAEAVGGFGGILDPEDAFGISASSLGDLDGDGIGDLVVGAEGDDDGGNDQGAVWILFLGDSDTTSLTLSCPPPLSVLAPKSEPHGTFVSFSVTAEDDCDPSPSVVCVPPSGSLFPWGTTTVTCTAMDASGNSSMCAFTVTVQPSVRRFTGTMH